MSEALTLVSRRPRLSIGLGLAVILFLFVTLIPFPYERTAAYSVTTTILGEGSTVAPENIVAALTELGHTNSPITITQLAGGMSYEVGGLPTKTSALEAGSALAVMASEEAVATIEPINEVVYQSLLAGLIARMRDRILTLHVKSDSELSAKIEGKILARIAERGFPGAEIKTSTEGDGSQRITIQRKPVLAGDTTKQRFELRTRWAVPILSDSTLSDDSLRTVLKAKLAEKGLTSPYVVVKRTPDGKRVIIIKPSKDKSSSD